jgi:hypothetical protein
MSSTPENSDPYVLQEHLNGVLKRRERRFGRRLSLSLATEHQFTRKFPTPRGYHDFQALERMDVSVRLDT